VLVNLLANAVKFTPSGGEVTVTCGSAREPEPGVWRKRSATAEAPDAAEMESPDGWAFVRITDTGPGIEPELFSRLFEPFVQGDPALTREHGGTGLGLAISRRLARLMDGDVVARSQPGMGATFTLWLPGAPEGGVSSGANASRLVSSEVEMRKAERSLRARTTLPPGMPAIDDGAGTMDDEAYHVLHALAVRLAAESETVSQRYVVALRSDGRFPGARELSTVQLRDHATPFVGLVAAQLMIMGETRGEVPELLSDGAQVQRVMAELHGAQRHRLGWSEADLEREVVLLIGETERALEAALSQAHPHETPSQSVRTAARYAATAARMMLERGAASAIRSYRFARSTSA